MLKVANTSVDEALKLFNRSGVPVGLLVPTRTGLEKSIMDATFSFREFLHEVDIHDYSTQPRGVKEFVPSRLVLPDTCIKTRASLYKPLAKPNRPGDPRIWFYNLTKYCKPTDLLAVVAYCNELYVFNMSNPDIVRAFSVPGSCPHEILNNCAEIMSPTAAELLGKLREINRLGFVPGIMRGDPAVGRTLENLLGIPGNSSKNPDYKGIELKASRRLGKTGSAYGRSKKVTLFTQVPDWCRSKFNAVDLIKTFGYFDKKGQLALRCTLSNIINPQGLYLDAKDEIDLISRAKTETYTGDVMVWAIDMLKRALLKKHNETFWIQASSKIYDGKEFFRYENVRHTRKPNVSNMASMFDAGILVVDIGLHLKKSGKARDHGYEFRTTSDRLSHIFPIERVYDLSS